MSARLTCPTTSGGCSLSMEHFLGVMRSYSGKIPRMEPDQDFGTPLFLPPPRIEETRTESLIRRERAVAR